jgi:hypothetical protein
MGLGSKKGVYIGFRRIVAEAMFTISRLDSNKAKV